MILVSCTCSLRLGELHANVRRARDFAVRFVANVVRLPKLSTLDLTGSGISQLPPSLLSACTGLTHLSIAGSRMRSLPVALGRLTKLVHLSTANSSRLQVSQHACAQHASTSCLHAGLCVPQHSLDMPAVIPVHLPAARARALCRPSLRRPWPVSQP